MNDSFRYLVYDIETVTDKNLLQRVLYPELEGDPEGAYQKHIEALAEEGRDFVNPSFHRPVTIAVAGLTSEFEIAKVNCLGKGETSTRALVEHFWEIYNQHRPVLVDFNGKGFDLRVLEMWAFRLGLAIHPSHFEKFGPRHRFSEEKHLDLHEFLTNYGAIRWKGGLDLFSKILGKPGKMNTKGDQVQGLFDEGKLFEIQDYCLGDVMDTYFVFLRTLVMRGVLELSQEQKWVQQAQEHLIQLRDEKGYFKSYLEHFQLWDPNQDDVPHGSKPQS